MSNNTRIAKWDNIKFILILCVVMGHVLNSYYCGDEGEAKAITLFIYSFHMPAFVFISGLFSKGSINGKRYDKIISYLFLFVVTKVCFFLSKIVIGKNSRLQFNNMDDLSWFAFAIFVFFFITIILKRFNTKWIMAISILFALIAGLDKEINTLYSLGRITTFYPFFLAGYLLNPQKLLEFTNKIWVKIIALLVFVGDAFFCIKMREQYGFLMKIFREKCSYNAWHLTRQEGIMYRSIWYIAAFLLIFSLIAIVPSVHSVFTTWGSRTLAVYCLHYIPMRIFFEGLGGGDLLMRVSPNGRVYLSLIVALLIVILLSLKPVKKIVDFFVYPKLAETRGGE